MKILPTDQEMQALLPPATYWRWRRGNAVIDALFGGTLLYVAAWCAQVAARTPVDPLVWVYLAPQIVCVSVAAGYYLCRALLTLEDTE